MSEKQVKPVRRQKPSAAAKAYKLRTEKRAAKQRRGKR